MQNCHNIVFLTYYSTSDLGKKINKVYCRRSRQSCLWATEMVDVLGFRQQLDVAWRIWHGDRGELSCAQLNGERQIRAKSRDLIDAFLACPPDWARGPAPQWSHRYAPNAVCCCMVAGQLFTSCRFYLWLSMLPSFQHSQYLCTIYGISIRQRQIFDQKRIFLCIIYVFLNYILLIFLSQQLSR